MKPRVGGQLRDILLMEGMFEARISSGESYLAEWLHYLPIEEHEVTTLQQDSLRRFKEKPAELAAIHSKIRQVRFPLILSTFIRKEISEAKGHHAKR